MPSGWKNILGRTLQYCYLFIFVFMCAPPILVCYDVMLSTAELQPLVVVIQLVVSMTVFVYMGKTVYRYICRLLCHFNKGQLKPTN
ncbi:hypothetical protein GDO86_010852 [Hymenochirus boettgeri]|uniref:Uncharacterized protein n=1 Tax=Hymenochirus boettgeri TaxID=247094 RepID=A0A8T2JE14_9PIPI|nr:hypothetical protein GDO86_010852 [Hymenochirus boettgeri]